jgi:hypothetical protein
MEYMENIVRLPISSDIKALEITTNKNGEIILTPITNIERITASEMRGILNGKFRQFYNKNAVSIIREERDSKD